MEAFEAFVLAGLPPAATTTFDMIEPLSNRASLYNRVGDPRTFGATLTANF